MDLQIIDILIEKTEKKLKISMDFELDNAMEVLSFAMPKKSKENSMLSSTYLQVRVYFPKLSEELNKNVFERKG